MLFEKEETENLPRVVSPVGIEIVGTICTSVETRPNHSSPYERYANVIGPCAPRTGMWQHLLIRAFTPRSGYLVRSVDVVCR